jgi:hypothetical protein
MFGRGSRGRSSSTLAWKWAPKKRRRCEVDLKLGSLNLEKLKFTNLYNMYLGLTSREQTIALIVAGALLVMIVFLPVTVASRKLSRLDQDIQKGNDQLREVVREIDMYQEVQGELRLAEDKLQGGFDSSIATTMEALASRAGIADRIDSLKEKPTAASDLFDELTVDVRLKKVGLRELITYLHSIEQNPDKLLRLKKLEIKPRFDNKKQLNASFSVSTYRLLETAGGGE